MKEIQLTKLVEQLILKQVEAQVLICQILAEILEGLPPPVEADAKSQS